MFCGSGNGIDGNGDANKDTSHIFFRLAGIILITPFVVIIA